MTNKLAVTDQPIHDLLASRWSPRAFDSDRAVSQDDLVALFEAARWAPSCFNEQPWRYLVWDRFEDAAGWQSALECLAPKNQEWALQAPVLALIACSDVFVHNDKPNRWSQYDAGQATASLTTQAMAMDLYVHQMGGFDAEEVGKRFGLPDGITAMAMMAIGYAGDPDSLDEGFRTAETAERERKALDDILFYGKWPAN